MSNRNTHPIPYKIVVTEDGSPTLHMPDSETMHSPGGALSETLYIYQPAVQWALKHPTPTILSVGLGLGYNELLCYAISLQLNIPQVHVHSFESEAFLRESFKQWAVQAGTSNALWNLYDDVCSRMAKAFELSDETLRSRIQTAVKNQELVFHGPLDEPLPQTPFVQGLLYDAYCARTSPQLWDFSFLTKMIKTYCDSNCAFATYAATGDLGRVLKSSGFQVEAKRRGFGKKRNSTLAYREPVME